MHQLRLVIAALVALSTLTACSAEYYSRRRAIREQRVAERDMRRAERDQQRIMERCGNAQRAYERGFNEGLQRRAMDTRWVGECPPVYQAQQQQAYVAGYQQGIDRAGTQIVVAAPAGYGGVVASPGVASCRFSSDCGADMHCRAWGNMGNVCMGYGGPGSPCWFSSDCLSGRCEGGSRTCR
ncbi:MAG: hypothetical protein KF729_38455 [Sandaracinaceae bacterium]|nr:hypothetical protein [Sandaracinaceae bacterium]